jgi:Tfp pilus assembly protein PilO
MSKPSSSRKLMSRTELYLHAAMTIVLVIGVTFGFAVRTTIGNDLERIQSDIQECGNLLEKERELAVAVAQVAKRKEMLEIEYLDLLQRVPKKIVDSEVLTSLREKGLETKCNFHDFRPTTTVDHKNFKSRSFELHLEGRFSSLFQFFESMNQIPYAYHVVRFKIKEPTFSNDLCQAELEIRILFDYQLGQDP